jgi:hypothetical protein
MLQFLRLGPNEYRSWLTYEGEYLNETLRCHPRVKLKIWGRFREGYRPGQDARAIVERLYGSDVPDVIMIDSSHTGSDHPDDHLLFNGLKELRKRCILIFQSADPWRFQKQFQEFAETIRPHFWLVHSNHFTSKWNVFLKGESATAHMFPYCIGRRYQDLGLERKYDLGLIGRCQLPQGRGILKPWPFRIKGLKVFHEAELSIVRRRMKPEQYVDRFATTITNLNQCLASWNSLVTPKGSISPHTPFRYLEAPACGAISLTTELSEELTEYYFPESTMLNCNGSKEEAIRLILQMRQHPEEFLEKQQAAYKVVMGNHQAENRVAFLLDLISGKEDADVRDYYNFPL